MCRWGYIARCALCWVAVSWSLAVAAGYGPAEDGGQGLLRVMSRDAQQIAALPFFLIAIAPLRKASCGERLVVYFVTYLVSIPGALGWPDIRFLRFWLFFMVVYWGSEIYGRMYSACLKPLFAKPIHDTEPSYFTITNFDTKSFIQHTESRNPKPIASTHGPACFVFMPWCLAFELLQAGSTMWGYSSLINTRLRRF